MKNGQNIALTREGKDQEAAKLNQPEEQDRETMCACVGYGQCVITD